MGSEKSIEWHMYIYMARTKAHCNETTKITPANVLCLLFFSLLYTLQILVRPAAVEYCVYARKKRQPTAVNKLFVRIKLLSIFSSSLPFQLQFSCDWLFSWNTPSQIHWKGTQRRFASSWKCHSKEVREMTAKNLSHTHKQARNSIKTNRKEKLQKNIHL